MFPYCLPSLQIAGSQLHHDYLGGMVRAVSVGCLFDGLNDFHLKLNPKP